MNLVYGTTICRFHWIMRHRDECMDSPPSFVDLKKAAKETQHRMGIAQPGGEAFRLKGKKEHPTH